jgi:hypothetical protein
MADAPYENTFRRGGDLCFLADVPAWKHIGARYEELTTAASDYVAPAAEQEQFRRLCERLQELIDTVATGGGPDWPTIQRQLSGEFGDCFAHCQRRVMGNIDEYFQSGQMPLAEYLEWHLHGAETLWSMNGGGDYGLDKAAFEARVERLMQRLQQSGYQTAAERRYRQESPERYEFMQQSLGLLNQTLGDDPPDLEALAVQQMELFRKSPFFAQAQGMLEEMRQRLEPLRQTDPELYEQQVANLENMRRFQEDPAAALRELTASLPASPFDRDDEDAAADDDEPTGESAEVAPPPPGRFVFNCGRCQKPSKRQIGLFQDLVARQEALRPGIERALRELHDRMGPGDPALSPGDRLLFPKNPDQTDVPLNCFHILEITLEDGKSGRAVLNLDSPFGHYDEHGCHIAIQNGVVGPDGTWDDVYGD